MTGPSPYAPLIDRVPVRDGEVALRGGLTRYRVLRLRRGPHGRLPARAARRPPRAGADRRPPRRRSGSRPRPARVRRRRRPLPRRPPRHRRLRWPGPRELLAAVAPGGDAVLAGHSFGSIVAAAAVAAGAPVRAPGAGQPDRDVRAGRPARRPRRRLTVLYHRLAAALPERAGTALLRSRAITRVASVAMVTTPDRDAAPLDPRRARPPLQRLRRPPGAAGGVRCVGRRTTCREFAAAGRGADAAGGRRARRHRARSPPSGCSSAGSPTPGWWWCRGTGHLAHYEAPAAVARGDHRVPRPP